ncbi:hypothetical protein COCC4DRAFT_150694, partial [Bipolaris maydis ATCC 48331]
IGFCWKYDTLFFGKGRRGGSKGGKWKAGGGEKKIPRWLIQSGGGRKEEMGKTIVSGFLSQKTRPSLFPFHLLYPDSERFIYFKLPKKKSGKSVCIVQYFCVLSSITSEMLVVMSLLGFFACLLLVVLCVETKSIGIPVFFSPSYS